MCCFDSIPFDITLHVLMCFGFNHMLIWFVLNHLSSIMCWFGFWYNLDNHFLSLFVVLSWFTWCFCPNYISFGSRKSLHACLLSYIVIACLSFLIQYIGYTPPNPKSAKMCMTFNFIYICTYLCGVFPMYCSVSNYYGTQWVWEPFCTDRKIVV